jgi:glyoxalase family protein
MASRVAFAVPDGALGAWQARLEDAGVDATTESVFDTNRLTFAAPDGLPLALVSDPNRPVGDPADSVWTTATLPASQAIRGFYGTTLPAVNASQTAALFTDVFGWTVVAESDERIRLQAPAAASGDETSRIPLGTIVDLKTRPAQTAGRMGKGAVHHVAFRARDDDEQAAWQSRLRERGLQVTDVKDRQYFRSIYVRDADWTSGILFEIATDGPGFLIDESEERLGGTLRLPSWLEDRRDELEQALPSIERPAPASSST